MKFVLVFVAIVVLTTGCSSPLPDKPTPNPEFLVAIASNTPEPTATPSVTPTTSPTPTFTPSPSPTPTPIPSPTPTPITPLQILPEQQIEYGFDAVRIRVFGRFYNQTSKKLSVTLKLYKFDSLEDALKSDFDPNKLLQQTEVQTPDVVLPFDFIIPYDKFTSLDQAVSTSVQIYDVSGQELSSRRLPAPFRLKLNARPAVSPTIAMAYLGDLYYVVVEEAFTVASLSDAKVPAPEKKFLILSVRIENFASSEIQLYTQDFELESDGVTYENNRDHEFDVKKSFYPSRDYLRRSGDVRDATARFSVPSGQARHTMLVFEVPQSIVLATLKFRHNNSGFAKTDIFVLPFEPNTTGQFIRPLMTQGQVDIARLTAIAVVPTDVVANNDALMWETEQVNFEGTSQTIPINNCQSSVPLPLEKISQQYETRLRESISRQVDVSLNVSVRQNTGGVALFPIGGFAGFGSLRAALQARFRQNQEILTEQSKQTQIVLGSQDVAPGTLLQISINERIAKLTGYLNVRLPQGTIRFSYASQQALGYEIKQQTLPCPVITPTP